MGRHLGIDFSSILVDFGSQVGRQNRAKIDQKWHRKNDEKKKGNKMAKKSQFEIQTPRGPLGPDPWRGIPPIVGQTPPPPRRKRSCLSLSLPKSCLVFVLPCLCLCLVFVLSCLVLSWPVLACFGLSWPVLACLVSSWLPFPGPTWLPKSIKIRKNLMSRGSPSQT